MTEISDYFQYRMRLGITSLKKWDFLLVLHSPFTIFR